MSKEPATFADMRNTIFDYQWKEVGEKRGGPIPGIKELLLAEDPETGAYSRIVLFQPGFKFDRALEHSGRTRFRLRNQYPLHERILRSSASGNTARAVPDRAGSNGSGDHVVR